MQTNIIKVYYGSDALPYKDKERTVHFPITGSTFIGSSDTTKIRFYVDGYLADENALWISVSKRADGTQGSQFLTSGTDENNDKYREMTLSGWYTEKNGDLYISLKGYQGGSTGYWDDETGMYIVQGVPVIRATGSIKLAINYAPVGEYPYYQDEMASFQDLVAQLGNKLDITSGIVVVSDISLSLATLYENGQLVYDKATKKLYQVSSGSFVVFFETYDKDTLDTKFSGKADKSNTYTKSEVDIAISSAISSVYKYKGSVATYSDLPSSDLTIGDVYNVEDTGDNYAWTGTSWDKLAGTVDLSDYATKSELTSGLATKQNTLVSGQNIKTINGQSILGSGDLPVSVGGSAEWGSIGGDIADQTDLQNELQNIREVAEGKCNTFVISYSDTIATVKSTLQMYVGNKFYVYNSTTSEWEDKTTELLNGDYDNLSICNSLFNSNNDYISPAYNDYLIVRDRGYSFKLIKADIDSGGGISRYPYKRGDVILVVETDVPDRWFSNSQGRADKLETSKIDLDNYATKPELATKSDLTNVAAAYDDTLTYTVGEVVSYNGKIYKCTTAITTPESWDSTHWAETSVASDFVNLTGTQTITGVKTFSNGIELSNANNTIKLSSNSIQFTVGNIIQARVGLSSFYAVNNAYDLGDSTSKWKDLYLSGTVYTAGIDLASNFAPVKISGNTKYMFGNSEFIPNGGQQNLGHPSYRWQDLYLSRNLTDGTNTVTVAEITKKPSTSYSLSDGGTITDNTLKSLIQNEQPIKLNGFTCYFSCDDGTNYQYVSTRYDSSANKNHINVITINKSTWVATFHTSDIAV